MSHLYWRGRINASTDVLAGQLAAAQVPALNALTAPTGAVDINSQRLEGVAAPSAGSHAANKTYVDDAIDAKLQGLSPKESVRLASTANVAGTASGTTITTGAATLNLNSVAVINGDRVLLKDQTAGAANGIYTVSGVGSNVVLTRAVDFDDSASIVGAFVLVTDGGKGSQAAPLPGQGTGWVLTSPDSDDSISVGFGGGDTAFTFAKFSEVDYSLTDEQVQDIAGPLVATGGTKTGIAVTYDDNNGNMDFVVDHDAAANYLAAEHVDWAASGAGTVHSSNYTDTNTQLSNAVVKGLAGAMVSSNTETGITVTYQSSDDTIDFVVADTTVAGDSGSTGMTPGDTLTIAGGANVTTAMSGDTLTITATDTNTQLSDAAVKTLAGAMVTGNTETGIAVTYQSGDNTIDFVVADTTVAGDSGSTGMTPGDTLTIAGGANVTTAMSGDTLTITATDTNTQLSSAAVKALAGAMVTGNTETGITVTYQSADDTFDFATEITAANISSHAITTGTIGNFAVTSVSAGDSIAASVSGGALIIDAAENPPISISQGGGSTNFINADHTITGGISGNLKSMYVYDIDDDRTLTLPRVGGIYAKIGTEILVCLLGATSGDTLTVARYSSDKIDKTAADEVIEIVGNRIWFRAVAASGDSTTTWVMG